jgi:hypothetical protein
MPLCSTVSRPYVIRLVVESGGFAPPLRTEFVDGPDRGSVIGGQLAECRPLQPFGSDLRDLLCAESLESWAAQADSSPLCVANSQLNPLHED